MPSDFFGAVFSVVILLLCFVFVLVAAYFTVKLAGRRYMGGAAAGYIKIVDRAALGPDRMLCIVKAADKTLLIGVTGHHIEALCELDEESLAASPLPTATPFSEVLTGVMKGFSKKADLLGKEDQHDDT